MTSTSLPPRIAGVILAGGQSRRMGQPKQLLRLADGQTMMEVVAQNLARACDTIIIASNEALPITSDYCTVIQDHYSGAGPLAGIESALSSGLADAYLFVGCDQPLLIGETLALLLRGDPYRAHFFSARDRAKFHSLPAYLPVQAYEHVKSCLDRREYSIRHLASLVNPEFIPIPHAMEPQFHNVNSPEDLVHLNAVRSEIHAG